MKYKYWINKILYSVDSHFDASDNVTSGNEPSSEMLKSHSDLRDATKGDWKLFYTTRKINVGKSILEKIAFSRVAIVWTYIYKPKLKTGMSNSR